MLELCSGGAALLMLCQRRVASWLALPEGCERWKAWLADGFCLEALMGP